MSVIVFLPLPVLFSCSKISFQPLVIFKDESDVKLWFSTGHETSIRHLQSDCVCFVNTASQHHDFADNCVSGGSFSTAYLFVHLCLLIAVATLPDLCHADSMNHHKFCVGAMMEFTLIW